VLLNQCHSNEQKCLDLIWGIWKYRPYLKDRQFLMRSDNKALTWLQCAKNGTTKPMRFVPVTLSGSRNPEPKKLDETLDVEYTERLLPPERRRYSLGPSSSNQNLKRHFSNTFTTSQTASGIPPCTWSRG
jgi:hypothetical protein